MNNGDKSTTNSEERNDFCIDLTSSMNEELATLAKDSYTVCIYRVSEKYRKSKEEAYTPRIVSIGPLHHGNNHLQAMEAYKLRYLHSFIKNFGIGIDKLIACASKMEDSVRGCYEATSKYNSKEFCRMIVLDGIFVVQLFVKNNIVRMRELGDMLFENQWMASDLMHDMLLLENQLPLNFILGLFEFVDSFLVHQKSFHDLSLDYFQVVGNTKRLNLTDGCKRSRHLVEFLVIIHRPSSSIRKKEALPKGRFEYTRSATELQAAGVRFCNGMGELFDVSFESGLLKLPQLTVNDKTETFFRNLIAYEQCGHYEKHITSYIIFMDSLINTAEDVVLLVKKGVIDNLLGENQLVADLFNNLYKEVIEEQQDFYFAEICNNLNKYSKDYIHQWNSTWFKWKLILKNEYFSNPWSIVAFIAASTVIVLTVIQTACSLRGL